MGSLGLGVDGLRVIEHTMTITNSSNDNGNRQVQMNSVKGLESYRITTASFGGARRLYVSQPSINVLNLGL